MSSVPNSYIDDLRSIVLATLNRIEQLRMRVLFGVQFVKGAYGQELEFRDDGKLYLDDVEVGIGGGDLYDIENQSFTNLLENGDFESWSAGVSAAPDGWILSNVTVLSDNANFKIGIYGAALTPAAAVSNSNRIQANIPISDLPSGYYTFGAWVKSTVDAARVRIDVDGSGEVISSHSGGGAWEFLSVTKEITTGAQLYVRLYPDQSNAQTTSYFDGAILVKGSVCPAFSPKPLVDDGKTIAINSATNVTTFGGDVDIDGSNLIDANSIIADTATDLTLTVDTGQAFVFSKV